MEIITLEEKISLHPKYICPDVNKYLYDKLNMDYKNKCLQKSGYILEIYPDFIILNNNIYSSTFSVILDVRLRLKVLKPEIGTKLNVNVLHVLKNGVLTECQSVLKIFIPSTNIKNMNFDSLKNCFTDNNTFINRFDIIEIEISKVRYENNKFDCIGIFIKKYIDKIIVKENFNKYEKKVKEFDINNDIVFNINNKLDDNKEINKVKKIKKTKENIHNKDKKC